MRQQKCPGQFAERFWRKVDKAPGHGPSGHCWIWAGGYGGNGYGCVNSGGRSVAAHRVAYEQLVDAIPAGLELDHLCRNPACVNPAHLEPVTHAENMRRQTRTPTPRARATSCRRGHSLSEAYVKPNGARNCRRCSNDRQQKRRDQQRTVSS